MYFMGVKWGPHISAVGRHERGGIDESIVLLIVKKRLSEESLFCLVIIFAFSFLLDNLESYELEIASSNDP